MTDKFAKRTRLLNLRSRFDRLAAKQDLLIKEEVSIISDVSMAKYRIGLKSDVQAVLDELQSRAQSRSVGLFERLLTAIVHDVMPGEGTDVVLDLSMERGRPSLDIMVSNHGNLEDVMDGRGGSITNIISTGLRFIALSRLKHRRFIVLDEADCWLRPDKVPAFASVISQMSKEIGVQCLFISHHDPEFFREKASIVELKKVSGHIVVDSENVRTDGSFGGSKLTGEDADHALMSGVGIRYVRLVNFMSHEDSMIPLSPNVTAIIGDNDIGKSAVVSAIRAVSSNGGTDAMIRHGQDKFVVEVGLEEGNVLIYTRRRRGQNKTSYRLETEDGYVLHEEDNGKTVPEWVDDYLYIKKVNGMDVHIGHQKEPVFMIGNSVTGTSRANLLSLGKESSYVQEMILAYADDVKDDGRIIRSGEKRIAEVRGELEILSPIMSIEGKIERLIDRLNEISELDDKISDIQSKIAAIEKITKRMGFLERSISVLSNLGDAPEIRDVNAIIALGKKLSLMERRIVRLNNLPSVIGAPPEIKDVSKLVDMLNRADRAKKACASSVPMISSVPDLKPVSDIDRLISRLEAINRRREEVSSSIARDAEDAQRIDADMSLVINALGGICPVCEGSLSHSQTSGA